MENLGLEFPRIRSVKQKWVEIKSNLKIWGYLLEESSGGGAKVIRARDDVYVRMLWMELLDAGIEKEKLEAFFKRKENNEGK